MTDHDLLNAEQHVRLAALYAVRDALHIEVDSVDLNRLAHYVVTGEELALHGELPGPDAARWSPRVVES